MFYTLICTSWIIVPSSLTDRHLLWPLAPPVSVNTYFFSNKTPLYDLNYNLRLPCLWSGPSDYITCLCWKISWSVLRAYAVRERCVQSPKLLMLIIVGICFRNDSHWASGRLFPFPGCCVYFPVVLRHVIHVPMCPRRWGQTHCLIHKHSQ